MRNLLRRQPSADPKPTLRERAAALKATAGRVMRGRAARPPIPTDDPAFDAIREHRTAYAAWRLHLDAISEAPGGSAALHAAEAAGEESCSREGAAFAALIKTRPTTLAGLLALARYLPGAIARNGRDSEDDDGVMGLASVCDALRDMAERGAIVADAEPTDWHSPPDGFMAHPAIEPFGFIRIPDALPLEIERLHGIALAEFERRRKAYRPTLPGLTIKDWTASLRRSLRLDALAAAASPDRAEPAGDDLSQPGFVLYEVTDGSTRRKPVADWIAYMAMRLYHVARNEEMRASNAALAAEPDQDANALGDRLRRDLRIDALFDLAFRPREVFEASREFGVGDRWRNGRGDAAHLDTELLALEAEFLPAHRAVVAARVAHDLAWDEYAAPPLPRELRVWRNDWIIKDFPRTWTQTLEAVGGKFVPVTHYGPSEVAQLRGMRCLRRVHWAEGQPRPDAALAAPDERAQERIDAIVAAWDRWQAEIVATKAALGLPALVEAFEAAKDRRGDILDRLRAVPARTLAGLGVKARVAFAMDDDTDPKRTGLDEYDAEHPAAFVYDVAGDVLALTATPKAEA